MDGKIAIEEYFVTPELEDLVLNPGWAEDAFRRTLDRLEDADEHLAIMDRHAIEMSVLSLASDGIQGVDDPALAVRRAREANDALAARVALHPDRFAGFAAVALQDPAAAASEAERGASSGWPFYVTISGNYHTPSLVGVLSELGPDRVMFAVDHPFEDVADGADWFDALDLEPAVRAQIASRNAAGLLQLAAV